MNDDQAATIRGEEIIPDNIRAIGAVYMAWQLEELRLFDVVDRLVERSMHGMLPIRDESGAEELPRYYSQRDERHTRQDRFGLYSRILGAPEADSADVAPNRDFNELWLAFLSAVSEFDRQQRTATPSSAQPPSMTIDQVRLAGRRLAANATSAIADATPPAVGRLIDETWQALEILKIREILSAYGVQSHWALIDRVAASDLAIAVPDIARHRTMGDAGKRIFDLVAADAAWWSGEDHSPGAAPPRYPELVRNAERWLHAASAPAREAR